MTSGNNQSAPVKSAFASLLVVTVQDVGGNSVSGTAVTFAAPATGASATFGSSATVLTGSNGQATSPVLTANATTGAYSVTAGVSGVSPSASFSLTNAAVPANVAVASGSGQNAIIGAAFGAPLVVTVTDGSSQPVAGVTVTFTVPDYRRLSQFRGCHDRSNFSAWRAGNFRGFHSELDSGNLRRTTQASLVLPHPRVLLPPTWWELRRPSRRPANPQHTVVSTAFGTPLVATVKDSGGNLLSGITVTFTAPASGVSATFGGAATTTTALTDSNGQASVSSFAANTVAETWYFSVPPVLPPRQRSR